jgi:hypothetical protein
LQSHLEFLQSKFYLKRHFLLQQKTKGISFTKPTAHNQCC